jgi:4-hydroxy-3-methylbut-2-enyl diphosphate reductase IspH
MVRAFEPPVYCYHEIVHNWLVVDRLRSRASCSSTTPPRCRRARC